MKSNAMRGLVAAAAPALLAGCAGTEAIEYEQSLARADASIQEAEDQGAARYGIGPLDRARDKAMEARQAADEGDLRRAKRLASEAELDAELASAITDTRQTEAALAEVKETIATLRDELLADVPQ